MPLYTPAKTDNTHPSRPMDLSASTWQIRNTHTYNIPSPEIHTSEFMKSKTKKAPNPTCLLRLLACTSNGLL
jgi:hypothetical protein